MKSNLMRVTILAAIAAAVASAQLPQPTLLGNFVGYGAASLPGVWDINVTVVNCQSGALIRTVRSVMLIRTDGTLTETANTATRGMSQGVWYHAYGQTYGTAYWFFRYKPDGTFASFAQAANTVTLSDDGATLSATGTVQDFDANGNLLSNGCVTHSAKRLVIPAPGN